MAHYGFSLNPGAMFFLPDMGRKFRQEIFTDHPTPEMISFSDGDTSEGLVKEIFSGSDCHHVVLCIDLKIEEHKK